MRKARKWVAKQSLFVFVAAMSVVVLNLEGFSEDVNQTSQQMEPAQFLMMLAGF